MNLQICEESVTTESSRLEPSALRPANCPLSLCGWAVDEDYFRAREAFHISSQDKEHWLLWTVGFDHTM